MGGGNSLFSDRRCSGDWGDEGWGGRGGTLGVFGGVEGGSLLLVWITMAHDKLIIRIYLHRLGFSFFFFFLSLWQFEIGEIITSQKNNSHSGSFHFQVSLLPSLSPEILATSILWMGCAT